MSVKKQDRRRKLSDAQRDEIAARHKAGESKNALAKEFEVRRYTISTIVNPELRRRDYLRSKDAKSKI